MSRAFFVRLFSLSRGLSAACCMLRNMNGAGNTQHLSCKIINSIQREVVHVRSKMSSENCAVS